MTELESVKQSIADCEQALENVWEMDADQEPIVRQTLVELKARLLELEPRVPKEGERWVDFTTGEMYTINAFGTAEGFNGVSIPQEDIMKHCLPYEDEAAKKPTCDSSESAPSPADVYEHLRPIQAEFELGEDILTYVWKKYPEQELQQTKLRSLASTLKDHPAWAIFLNEINEHAVSEVGLWEKRLRGDLVTIEQQYKRRKETVNGNLEFINQELMPRIVEWTKGKLEEKKSKNKYLDLDTVRVQLTTTKDTFVKGDPEKHVAAMKELSDEERKRWGVKIMEVKTIETTWDLNVAKAEAIKVYNEAMKLEGKDRETKLAEIPTWLKFKPSETTGSFRE